MRTGPQEAVVGKMAALAPMLTTLRGAMAKTPKPDTAAAGKALAELKVGPRGTASTVLAHGA